MGRTTRSGAPAGEPTITLLHLSDMQFGRHHRFGRLGLGGPEEAFDTLLKRLTDDLELLRTEEGLKPELVVLTGDLAETGRRKEYDDVLTFCEGLQAYLKVGRDRILVIPGNHDINRDACAAYFHACKADDEVPKDPYWPKWKPYVDFFGKLYAGVDRYAFKETAPYSWFDLPELGIVVAGLNSTMRESHLDKDPDDPGSLFGHYGHVGEAQLGWFKAKLDEAAERGLFRLGLVHHNAVRRAENDDENLRDAELLQDRLGERLNLLLHGHTHEGSFGRLGNLPVISTGSAAVKAAQRPEEVPNQYQIVQIHRGGFRRWAREYTPRLRKWRGDVSISRNVDDWRHEEPASFARAEGTFGARTLGPGKELRASRMHAEDREEDSFPRARVVDDLLDQVMASCRVRDEAGRVQLVRVDGEEGSWGDYCRVTDPARGTYLLGAHAGPLTRTILDRWIQDVHEPFWNKGHRLSSELVITSGEPFSDEVKTRAGRCGVQLWRRVDYENLIDTQRWKTQQRQRLDGNPEYRRELYLEQQVTLWSPVDDVKEPVYPAADRLARMLCESDGSFVLVLGPAGTGKTFLLREVARRMMELQSVVTPLVIELHGLDRAQDVYNLVAWEFARYRQTLPARAFERDLAEGRLALLFDGFDELAIRVRSAAIPEHFARILGAARGRARVMVASRAEHFISARDAVEVLMSRASVHSAGLAGQLQAIAQRRLVATQKFSHEDITEYLGRALGSVEAGLARMQRFRQVHDLPGLAATPRMLSFLLRLTEEQLDAAAARKDAITSAELYRLVIVDHWLAQQEARLNPPGSVSGPTREALLEAATCLARHLWRSTARSVAAMELEAHVGAQLLKLCEADSEAARQMLQGRTLLTHGEGGRFEFVHQTVMEWLVGQALAAEIGASGQSADLEQGRLDDFMIDVLRELLGDEVLAGWAERSLEGTPPNRLAENARLALARMKREVTGKRVDLRGQDLRGQSLEGQDLRGALLDGADMRGLDLAGRDLSGASMKGVRLGRANLRGAVLADVNLEEADLSFAILDLAQLDRVRLAGASLLGMRALGATGTFDRTSGRFAASAAWDMDAQAACFAPPASECNTVAFGPDGALLATGHSDGMLRLWDAERGQLLRLLEGHTNGVMSVAWSPDGRRLASGSSDHMVRVWEAGTGEVQRTLEGHTNSVLSVAWSPDGGRLASGSYDHTVRLWEAGTGEAQRTLEGHANRVLSVAWSPDGRRLASGSSDHTVRLWEAGTGEAHRTLEGHTNWVQSVAWSPDGTRVASGSSDHTVRLWEARTGEAQWTLGGHTDWVLSVTWSPDGTRLASGSSDHTVRLWKAGTGEAEWTLEGHANSVQSVAWSPDETRLASGSSDHTVRLWATGTGESQRTLDGHTDSGLSVAWSPDGTRLASGSSDHTVRLWEAGTGESQRTLEGHTDCVLSVAWSPDGRRLASGSYDKTVRVWEAGTGEAERTLEGHTSLVLSVAWSPDGRRLASGSSDHTVRVWGAGTGEAERTLEGHTSLVLSVAWSPDGRCLASGSYDKTVRVWEAGTGEAERTLERHTNVVLSVAWSPDGRCLASGSSDKTVCVWEAGTGEVDRILKGHTNVVLSVAWSPDSRRLASGSSDKTVRVWEAGTGRASAVLRGHQGAVSSVSWSPDGKFLVSSDSFGTLRLWDTTTGECLAVYVATPTGAVAYRPRDGHYRTQGNPAGRVFYSIGLARYELGELDEFIPGGLRLAEGERLLPL